MVWNWAVSEEQRHCLLGTYVYSFAIKQYSCTKCLWFPNSSLRCCRRLDFMQILVCVHICTCATSMCAWVSGCMCYAEGGKWKESSQFRLGMWLRALNHFLFVPMSKTFSPLFPTLTILPEGPLLMHIAPFYILREKLLRNMANKRKASWYLILTGTCCCLWWKYFFPILGSEAERVSILKLIFFKT